MMPTTSVSIPARFNGPPGSGNGGYSCGVLAILLEGAARVRLFAPPPLDKALSVSCHEDGHLEMHDAQTLIGAAYPAELDLEVPPAPTLAQAEQASKSYPCYHDHAYPRCYVCGPERTRDDGLCLFPGPVNDWNTLMHDDGFRRLDMIQTLQNGNGSEYRTTRCPIRINNQVIKSDLDSPTLGQHNESIRDWLKDC